MRISDWSSDVCSADLARRAVPSSSPCSPNTARNNETPPMRLKDRIALITGASRGIGAAIAKRYAAEGAHVICVARTTGALEELDDAIRAQGGRSEEHTSELQSLMRNSYAVFGLKKKKNKYTHRTSKS